MSIQCPNCKSYNTMSVKGLGGTVFFILAGLSGFFGLFIFPLLIFAVIFLVLAIFVTVTPQSKKGAKEYSCLNCQYKWKQEKRKIVS
jgi:hypothetical protein